MGRRSKLWVLLLLLSSMIVNLTGCSLVGQAIGYTLLVYLIIYIPIGIVFGIGTNKIIENKGYRENWFWWGFFFTGVAMIVAACKPENRTTYTSSNRQIRAESQNQWRCSCGRWNYNYLTACECGLRKVESVARAKASAGQLNSNEWRCVCGRVNPSYMGTCACGKRKSEAFKETEIRNEVTKELIRKKTAAEKGGTTIETVAESPASTKISSEQEKVKLLKEYKELFDSGVISEEEFNAKKASILKD